MRSRDPTRSAGLRKHGRALANKRVHNLYQRLRQGFQEHDVVGLRASTSATPYTFINWVESVSHKLARAEGMIEHLIDQTLLAPPEWPTELIERSVAHGIELVEAELSTSLRHLNYSEVSGLHAGEAVSEVRGIASETQRRLLRNVVRALEAKAKPEALMREVRGVMEKITRLRLHLMVNTLVVRAVNAGKLHAYAAEGISKVGIEPEWLRHDAAHQHDSVAHHHHRNGVAVLLDARSKKAKRRKRVKANKAKRKRGLTIEEQVLAEGLGVLVGGQGADLLERAVEALGEAAEQEEESLVNVLTAGDDRVCEDCEDIAAEGPYDLDTAKGLIPAHPNCRCAFIPWDDKRFAPIAEQEEDEWF
jgi:hypothetical protein